jgi:hypothetical protein
MLQALNCDSGMIAESKKWCIEGLMAFQRYRDGQQQADGMINHSFQARNTCRSLIQRALIEP